MTATSLSAGHTRPLAPAKLGFALPFALLWRNFVRVREDFAPNSREYQQWCGAVSRK